MTETTCSGVRPVSPVTLRPRCLHDRERDAAVCSASESKWRAIYTADVAHAQEAYRAAATAAAAECKVLCLDSETGSCDACETSLKAATAVFRKALTRARQKIYRSRNMWARRHPVCHCGYEHPLPKPPFRIRLKHQRTGAEILTGQVGSGAPIGAAASRTAEGGKFAAGW